MMKGNDSKTFVELLKEFVDESSKRNTLSDTEKAKLDYVSLLLDGKLRFGGVAPRGPRKTTHNPQIGDEIELSPEHLKSEASTVNLMSAKASEDKVYGARSDDPIDYPSGSTYTDRHRIKNGVLSGFARSNVRSTADMNGCSLVTCRDFLIFASEELDIATFALIWVTFFLGLNHNRPIIQMRNGCRYPLHDEILVDVETCVIVYNLIRRRSKKSDDSFEVCGRMTVSIGSMIARGLQEIVQLGTQPSCIAAAHYGASKYSRLRGGLVPTLVRLRASGAIHLARLGLTELQSAALRGRVPPAIFGVSAYYPHTVREIVGSFKEIYQRAVELWHLPSSLHIEFGEIGSIDDGPIYCPASRGKALVANYFGIIGTEYQSLAENVCAQRVVTNPTTVIDALNTHELCCYMLQEIGLGLRPIGDVAQASLGSRKYGALTRDKASRWFSERSYAPITFIHDAVLTARQENRDFARRVLANIGTPLKLTEPTSDLAMRFTFDADSGFILGRRVRGAQFREFTKDLPTMLLGIEERNWLRHASTELLGKKIPRWQSDELHGHKLIGREPFGAWSTVSMLEFQALSECLEALHEELVPASLLLPIRAAGTMKKG